MATRKDILAKLDRLTMDERAQLDRLEAAGEQHKLETDPTEKAAYDKREADINAAQDELKAFDKFEERRKSANEREERFRKEPTRQPIETPPNADPKKEERKKNFVHYLRTGEVRALQVGDNAKGGYLADDDFQAEIIKNETEYSDIRSLATVKTTRKRNLVMPRRTAQFAAVWAGELVARTETEGLRYGIHETSVEELVAVVDITNDMLEDTEFDMEQELKNEISEQFAVAENASFVTGNGVKKPLGFTADSLVTTLNSGSNGDFDADDLIDLLYGLKNVYQRNAGWFFNRTTMRKIRKLKANNEYIWLPSDAGIKTINGGLAETLLGKPVFDVPEMANTGSTGAISVAVGDIKKGYLVLDHVDTQILRDPYTQQGNGLVRFWARKRVGGQAKVGEAIRLLVEAA